MSLYIWLYVAVLWLYLMCICVMEHLNLKPLTPYEGLT